MKLTIEQTRLGTFNEYILRDEHSRYLRADGTFTNNPDEARKFADVEHASTVAAVTEHANPTLHLTDEEIKLATRPAAPVAEVKVIDAQHVSVYLPKGATLPTEYAGWTGQQSEWNEESGEERMWLERPAATPAPTGHVRLAWLALLGTLALALSGLAIAGDLRRPTQEKSAPRPDAGTPNFCPQSNWPCDCPGNPDCTIKPG